MDTNKHYNIGPEALCHSLNIWFSGFGFWKPEYSETKVPNIFSMMGP